METLEEKETVSVSQDLPEEEELSGWGFHKWPFLIALGITIFIYIVIFGFVDPNPPHFDPSDLPPPPAGG